MDSLLCMERLLSSPCGEKTGGTPRRVDVGTFLSSCFLLAQFCGTQAKCLMDPFGSNGFLLLQHPFEAHNFILVFQIEKLRLCITIFLHPRFLYLVGELLVGVH